jgi:phosphonoacetaldehyde hydrolase
MSFTYRRQYRGPIKAVVFDMAGTVIDYGSQAPAASFVELFKKRNIEITTAQARKPMGLHKRDHIREILAMTEVDHQWRKKRGGAPTEEDLETMYREFVPIQVACLPMHGTLIPGAAKIYETLHARNVKIGVTTGYTKIMLDIALEYAGKQHFIPDAAFCADDVPRGRPAPWMIYKCLEQLKIYPPEAVVKVGDTIPDIEEGLNAGVWTVGVAKTGNMIGLSVQETAKLHPEELDTRLRKAYNGLYRSGAHFVVDGISDLIRVVNKVESRLAAGEKP